MNRFQIEMVVETDADLTPTSVVRGNYIDRTFVDRLFACSIARYEADEGRRLVSFKIVRLESAEGTA